MLTFVTECHAGSSKWGLGISLNRTRLAGQRHFVSTWARNAKKNSAFGMSFTPVVLVLNEVVLILLLDIAWETCGSTKSTSAGETPEYE